ncbi:hypothetical protein [Burkholderia lata]|uniref:hypothetical protein n=1 Tax=Burkholderia lata (strain ATCC 17760 / DSM 23089 / LMG 22485 / NCIMB 9086 / R18194 / 383) TaxID=482957 RepID=UPI0015832694|nr:hypothetical protein [Burkholderia lata]
MPVARRDDAAGGMTAAVRFDVPPPLPSIQPAVPAISFPTDRPARTFFILQQRVRARSGTALVLRPLASPFRANVCGSFSLLSSLRFGPDDGLGRLLMHAIYDPELTVELINVLEIMRAAKCRSKTFVFMSQSFARKN